MKQSTFLGNRRKPRGGRAPGGAKTDRAKPGGGQGTGGCASPPAQIVWAGYDWAQGYNQERVFTDKRSMAEQTAILNSNSKTVGACLFLTLLSFHRYGDDRRFFERKWEEVPLEKIAGVLGEYTRMTKRRLVVCTPGEDGRLERQATTGGASGDRRHILLVPSGGGGWHALPLGVPNFDAVVELPAAVAADIVPQIKVAAAPVQPPAGEPVMDDSGSSGPMEQQAMPAAESAVVASAPPNRPIRSNWRWGHPASPAFRLLPVAPVPVSYVGIQAPPPHVTHCDWRGGWFASQCPARPGLVVPQVLNLLTNPQLASATVANFERFGHLRIKYVPVRFENGLQKAGRRTVTDGLESTEFFTAGDTLHANGRSWSVQRDGSHLLKVVACDVKAEWLSTRMFFRSRRGTRVHAPADSMTEEGLVKAKWAVVCGAETDPGVTSILSRARGDAAMAGYKGSTDPESVADLARILTSRYRSAGNVAGPYKWGHCYSCGAMLSKGANAQRICRECRQRNSLLGRMIAEGCKVTSDSAPLRYPGVVWTKSRHPPLKPGVVTVATGENFHMPRRY